jgi:hypothetical protein
MFNKHDHKQRLWFEPTWKNENLLPAGRIHNQFDHHNYPSDNAERLVQELSKTSPYSSGIIKSFQSGFNNLGWLSRLEPHPDLCVIDLQAESGG